MAARPSVLVLDDPLSALDVDTEARVEAGLRRVLADTTALIVAHRPSTVMLADRVALLEDGRITDVGRHSELLERNDHYRYVISSLEEQRRTRERRRGGDGMSRAEGVEGEDRQDYTRDESRAIRKRSSVLLGSLLRPLRGRVDLGDRRSSR